jgi:hypothetical protein
MSCDDLRSNSQTASKLIFLPLTKTCCQQPPCAGCARMGGEGFYRLVWQVARQDRDPKSLIRMYSNRLFGMVICAN